MNAYNFSLSFKFIDVFSNYQEFKEYTDTIGVTNLNSENVINEKLFYFLLYRYANRDINFETIEEFKRQFAIEYINQFRKMEMKYKLLDSMYSLSLDELRDNGTVIINSNGNDKANIENPAKPLNYVINQTVNYNEKPKLLAYLEALNTIETENIDEFLNSFNYLFSMFLFKTEAYY